MKRRNLVWFSLLLTAPVFGETVGVTDQDVLIGACTTLSGPEGFFGVAMTEAAQAYFTMVNAQGGIRARQIVLQPVDDKFDVGESTACFRDQLSGAAFAAGFAVSTESSEKYSQLAGQEGMPLVGFFPAAEFLTEPARRHVFTVRPGYRAEVEAMIEHLSKDVGARRVGVIFQKDAQGDEMMRAVRQVFRKHGAALHAAPGGAAIREKEDIDKAIEVLRAGNPDAVILALSFDLAADLVTKARAAHWNPLFVGFSTMGAELFVREAGPAAEGVVISQVLPSPGHDSKLPAVQLYRKAVEQLKPRFNPSYPGFEGFVTAMVIAAGLKDSGEVLTRERFLAALEAMHRRDIGLGPEMPLQFSKTDHEGLQRIFFTVVEKRQLQPLFDWKKLSATSPRN